jgi:hypothetical protein
MKRRSAGPPGPHDVNCRREPDRAVDGAPTRATSVPGRKPPPTARSATSSAGVVPHARATTGPGSLQGSHRAHRMSTCGLEASADGIDVDPVNVNFVPTIDSEGVPVGAAEPQAELLVAS